MLNKIITVTVLASLITGSVSADTTSKLVLSETSNDQFLALLAPLAIGGLAALLSKGAEPEAAKKMVVDDVKKELSSNALNNDEINLVENSGNYAMPLASIIEKTGRDVSSILDKVRPRLQQLLGQGKTPEQATEMVTKENESDLVSRTVKQIHDLAGEKPAQ